ncbi:MAG: sulfite exporter TauE/SafE family protein [Phycisphaerales bacterium]|nr:sulfite exporter TauE/SafE family protein [Phycisphaerales bacterium]
MLLALAILVLAMLYSSVGHAGASGYLAAMALVTQMPQEEMKAVALTLNIFVGAIATWRFVRAGHFDWATFWPLGLPAIPMAFVGGFWQLPPIVFKPLVGGVLVFAAVMLLIRAVRGGLAAAVARNVGMPPLPLSIAAGAGLGLLAGLTGTGGGIFLSPLLLLCGWATAKRTAAVTIVFVLTNSLAGLGGVIADSPALPSALPLYIVAAVVGGLVGSGLGARRLAGDWIRVLLAIVLLIAAAKMFLTAFD